MTQHAFIAVGGKGNRTSPNIACFLGTCRRFVPTLIVLTVKYVFERLFQDEHICP